MLILYYIIETYNFKLKIDFNYVLRTVEHEPEYVVMFY